MVSAPLQSASLATSSQTLPPIATSSTNMSDHQSHHQHLFHNVSSQQQQLRIENQYQRLTPTPSQPPSQTQSSHSIILHSRHVNLTNSSLDNGYLPSPSAHPSPRRTDPLPVRLFVRRMVSIVSFKLFCICNLTAI